jgi:hypothetical protein
VKVVTLTPLEVARTQLDVIEERGNRGVPFTRYALTGEDPLPWCARFVRYCFTQAGIRLPGNRYLIGRVQTMLEELQRIGAELPVRAVLEPGDLIFLRDRGSSDQGPGHHVGIVESVGGLTVNSIDGNWQNRVQRVARERHASEIAAFCRYPVRPMA